MKRGKPLARRTPLTTTKPMKRTPLISRSVLKATVPLSRGAAIPAVSRKRAKQNRSYTAMRREFLASRPGCEFPRGCTQAATEVQHLRGRRGERLLDTAWWAASCHAHNQWAEDHTGEALAIGWLVRIEGAA